MEGRPEATVETAVEARAAAGTAAAMSVVKREVGWREEEWRGAMMVAELAVMVATVASAEKRVGTASIATSPPRSDHPSQPST